MLKYIGIITALIFTSFYIFPFEPAFMPGVNVKMMFACLSFPLILIEITKKGEFKIPKDVVVIFLYSLPITFFSWLSNIYNNTYDYSFNYYFVSIFVWMGAAYVVVRFINLVHGRIGVRLLANYLIGVCCFQCILALVMAYNPTINDIVNGMMASGGEVFMGNSGDRMHGLGCALDVAGGRFATVLIMIAYLLTHTKTKWEMYFYIVSFLIISIIGNMIGRTTTVGVAISLVYWIYDVINRRSLTVDYVKNFAVLLLLAILLVFIIYNTSDIFHKNLRFGFEGFFSLFEKGEWQTGSNDILLNMVVFPDNLKTWLIGDGYGANPDNDPYYVGPAYHGFYMGTDIGYLRFIFFFGIFGMISMVMMLVCFCVIFCQRFRMYKNMILMIFMLNLIIWFKVTSDLLPFFVFFLCISKEENDEYEANVLKNTDNVAVTP